jgi:hypothetical protein
MHWLAVEWLCMAVLQQGHAKMPLLHALDAAAPPQHASLDMDLSCSESGDDLASSCLSPSCASNQCFQRELSPPLGAEVSAACGFPAGPGNTPVMHCSKRGCLCNPCRSSRARHGGMAAAALRPC